MRHLPPAIIIALSLGCATEPDDLEPFPYLDLDPVVMFLAPGETKPVLVRYFLPDGDLAHADLTLSASGGITARIDSTFRRVYSGDGSLIQPADLTEQRLLVTLTGETDEGAVTVSAGAISRALRVIAAEP